jgi:hypothetical protein
MKENVSANESEKKIMSTLMTYDWCDYLDELIVVVGVELIQ